jgi:carbon monoxide dehydrogenase subunit G
MDMVGQRLISASKETVWEALNNPVILKTCIPGCERLEAVSANEMQATVAVKLGPISAKFTGQVKFSEIDAPNGYTLSGEGKGGPAGFAKGAAKVKLAEQPNGTLLTYTVEAQVGGKIAQLGARLIDATAKSMADQFFTKFVEQVLTPSPEETPSSQVSDVPKENRPASGGGNTPWLLIAVATAIAVVGWLLVG